MRCGRPAEGNTGPHDARRFGRLNQRINATTPVKYSAAPCETAVNRSFDLHGGFLPRLPCTLAPAQWRGLGEAVEAALAVIKLAEIASGGAKHTTDRFSSLRERLCKLGQIDLCSPISAYPVAMMIGSLASAPNRAGELQAGHTPGIADR